MVHTIVNDGVDTLTNWHTSSSGDKRGSTDNHYRDWLNDMRIGFYEEADYGSDIDWSGVGSGVNVTTTFPGTPSKGVIFRRKNTNANSGKVREYTYDGTNWVSVEYDSLLDYFVEVTRGNIPGHAIMKGFGERENVGTTAAGEDITRLNELSNVPALPASDTFLPTPGAAGEQMTVVSESANDDTGGAGASKVTIKYLDASGDEQTEEITMDGTTEVDTVATDIRFVQEMYVSELDGANQAAGNIRIFKIDDNTLVYNMIAAGGNQSLVPHRMVPNGKTLHLYGWHCAEAQNKRMNFRLRTTSKDGVITPGIFLFKNSERLKQSSSGELRAHVKVPALATVKISAWAIIANGEGSCSWWGVLVDD